MKVLLIGGAGFIGSFVCREFIKNNITPVVFDPFYQYLPKLVPDENRIKALKKRFEGISDKIELIRGHAKNYGEVRRLLEKEDYLAVIFLGGIPLASKSNMYMEEAAETIKSVVNIIQAIHDTKKKTRFVYTSSSTVYGDFQYEPADEEHPKNPFGVYAGVKLAGEEITKSFCRHFKIPYVIIRPSGVYGPTDLNKRVVQKFIENAMNGKEIIVKGPEMRIDFTYVKDTAKGFYLASVKKEAINQTFNITAGNARSLKELADIIKKHFPDVKIIYSEPDKTLPKRGTLDITKARKLLNYEPEYDLEKGISAYLKYYYEGII